MTTTLEPATLTATPTRFNRDPEWAARSIRTLFLLQGDRRPFSPEEVEWARTALNRGDDLGNRLARTMVDDHAFSMRDLDEALTTGETTIPSLRDLLAVVDGSATPTWVDFAAIERGAAVCRRSGELGLDVLATASLMTGFTSSATTRQLVGTGKLVDDPGARLQRTAKWWSEIIAPGAAMRPHHSGWKAAVRIRIIHGLANTMLSRQDDWDRAEWGEPINQSDQLATIGLFSTTFLLALRGLGMPLSRAEGNDVMALWRYVGWLLGVDEDVLPATEFEGRRRMVQVGQYAPAPDANTAILGAAMYEYFAELNYPRMQAFQRRFGQRYRGSLQAVFVGQSGLRELGIPAEHQWAVPVAWARYFPIQMAARLSPRVREWATRRGERRINTLISLNIPDGDK
ncbi:DUF2236 domain-containing protein [Gordonia sp. X0973]|uniref:oxygenase MpaB family protein n=1 Tax=Gordonia sp. X0973 TaxID=2742602 RepID=UPI000F520A55|nr:oxygenase MpaB family protein [Gordonia sp. X0973]QKT07796.1 DUF2236 domain-containing protein [Gordonia sp. X0973]